MQEDVQESLLIREELVKNKTKIKKLKYQRKSLVKEQEELEMKLGQMSDDVKDLEARIASGRRGEEVMVDVSYPDLLGADDMDETGIDAFFSSLSLFTFSSLFLFNAFRNVISILLLYDYLNTNLFFIEGSLVGSRMLIVFEMAQF